MDKNKTAQAVEEKKPIRKGFFASAQARLLMLTMALASVMSVSAFAADGAGDTLGDTITVSALLAETGVFTKQGLGIIWSMIVANPVLEATVGVGLLGLIFTIFRKAKRAARF